jgi:hypothetical protein
MFAVELFVVFFCALCCFFYSSEQETSKVLSEENEIACSDFLDFEGISVGENFSFSIETEVENLQPTKKPELLEIIDTLSWKDAKAVVTDLKNQKVTNAKLAGKGTGGKYFHLVLKNILPAFEVEVSSAIRRVLAIEEIPV